MARINVEESLFSDRRYYDLCIKLGSPEAALGALVFLWITAQRFWKNDCSRIPKEVWESQKLNLALLETGWAIWDDLHNGFYASGSEEQFGWLLSKQQNGKLGGKVSGEVRRRDFNSLQRSERKRIKANSSESNPLTLTHAHTQNNLNTCSTDDWLGPLRASESNMPVSGVQLDLELIYKSYPRKIGKQAGLKKLRKHIKTENDFQKLAKAVENYAKFVQKTEPQFIKHFSTFAAEWQDWLEFEPEKSTSKIRGFENL